ncbi:hypothetical protein GZH46_00655, partial [Fragariocoptes setiger]
RSSSMETITTKPVIDYNNYNNNNNDIKVTAINSSTNNHNNNNKKTSAAYSDVPGSYAIHQYIKTVSDRATVDSLLLSNRFIINAASSFMMLDYSFGLQVPRWKRAVQLFLMLESCIRTLRYATIYMLIDDCKNGPLLMRLGDWLVLLGPARRTMYGMSALISSCFFLLRLYFRMQTIQPNVRDYFISDPLSTEQSGNYNHNQNSNNKSNNQKAAPTMRRRFLLLNNSMAGLTNDHRPEHWRLNFWIATSRQLRTVLTCSLVTYVVMFMVTSCLTKDFVHYRMRVPSSVQCFQMSWWLMLMGAVDGVFINAELIGCGGATTVHLYLLYAHFNTWIKYLHNEMSELLRLLQVNTISFTSMEYRFHSGQTHLRGASGGARGSSSRRRVHYLSSGSDSNNNNPSSVPENSIMISAPYEDTSAYTKLAELSPSEEKNGNEFAYDNQPMFVQQRNDQLSMLVTSTFQQYQHQAKNQSLAGAKQKNHRRHNNKHATLEFGFASDYKLALESPSTRIKRLQIDVLYFLQHIKMYDLTMAPYNGASILIFAFLLMFSPSLAITDERLLMLMFELCLIGALVLSALCGTSAHLRTRALRLYSLINGLVVKDHDAGNKKIWDQIIFSWFYPPIKCSFTVFKLFNMSYSTFIQTFTWILSGLLLTL